MNNLLLLLAALLVLVLSALFAAPLFIDWSDYRAVLEQQASRLIGRQVKVGDDVSLTILPSPYLRFEDVTVADAAGGYEAPFLTARSFTLWLAVPPLLRGVVEAREVELDLPVLNLRIGSDGTGNWADVGRADTSLPFVPRSVALDSVKIAQGTVRIARADAAPQLAFEQLNGELSARSLQGPYKFTGTVEAGGGTHALRLSTGKRLDDGAIRVKAAISGSDDRQSYLFDGQLTGFAAVPRFAGEFRALFRAPASDTTAADADAVTGETAPVALKADVSAGLQRAQVSDLEITVRRGGKPQTVRGALELAYGDRWGVTGALTSRWVNLDVIAPGEAGEGAAPLAGTIAALGRQALPAAARLGEGRLTLALDQAVLAGDLVQDVALELASGEAGVSIRQLTARLPGDNALSLTGDISATGTEPSFVGSVSVSGDRLVRLLSWWGLQTRSTVVAGAGEFSLEGALSVSADTIALAQARGALLGSAFDGAFRYSRAGAGALDLTLRSDRLDISRVLGPQAEPVSLPALLGHVRAAEAEDAEEPVLPLFGDMRTRLDVDIGEIILPGLGKAALRAGLHVDGGAIDIPSFSLRADTGLSLEAKGRLSELGEAPDGSIAMAAEATTADAVQGLVSLVGLGGQFPVEGDRLEVLVPVQLTAEVQAGAGSGKGLALRLDGTVGGSDAVATLQVDGPPAEWRNGEITLDVDLKNADGRRLLRQLLPRLDGDDPATEDSGNGRLTVTATGVPEAGLDSKLTLKAAGLDGEASGRTRFDEKAIAFAGQVRAALPDHALLTRLAGVRTAPGRAAAPLSLAARIDAASGVWAFADLSGSTGAIRFTGSGKLDLSGERARVALDLEANEAALPVLLEPLVAWDKEQPAPGAARDAGWLPDAIVDSSPLAAVEGSLTLRADRLLLAGAVGLDQGELTAGVEDGVLRIKALEGGLHGGTFKAQADLTARGSGVELGARLEARGVRLERLPLAPGAAPLARGAVDLDLVVTGRGLSPRGLASGLSGHGTLALAEGEVLRLSPDAPRQALIEIGGAGAGGKVDEARLAVLVRRHLAGDGFVFRAAKAPVEIRNGVARIEAVTLENPAGTAAVRTFLELATLKLDSEWLLSVRAREGQDAPRVTLVFAGPFAQLGQLTPDIDTRTLQRMATIRRIEKDIETLEELEVPKPDAARRAPQATPPRARAIPAARPPEPVPERTPPERAASTPVLPAPPPAPAPAPGPGTPAGPAALPWELPDRSRPPVPRAPAQDWDRFRDGGS